MSGIIRVPFRSADCALRVRRGFKNERSQTQLMNHCLDDGGRDSLRDSCRASGAADSGWDGGGVGGVWGEGEGVGGREGGRGMFT